ncbi:hypothetical protein NEMIN01_1718 [Nematocida minor]|uniref:uncharacterized protein n=1 Tax=Nematocida minor TaxID=1912983 RepID=UPI00221F9055|nr:uncharacterized protein NEMIN01_1718 [Nematocida minor]KAI5191900.1 hypothetical protein NEMIN01_1718 [Nematocida minor]
MEQTKSTEEVFAGASFNDAPNPQDLPIPNIPKGFVLKKKQEPEKQQKKQKKYVSKNK